MTVAHSSPPSSPTAHLPPLRHGDRLTRAEFLERYEAMPDKVKAERIEGVVHMPAAAVSSGYHGRPHALLISWLGFYECSTPGVAVIDNATVMLEIDNEAQPDACLVILPSHGGTTTEDDKRCLVGAPDLVIEVAASSTPFDLGVKLDVYRRNGVREYIVHRVHDAAVDWFVLRDGQYVRLTPGADGILRSEIFPGLWLDVEALVSGKLAALFALITQGAATPEHAAFVAELAKRRESNGQDAG